MRKNRGMILICTLAIMIILNIFLLAAVYHTLSSTFVSKRMMWNIKSFWAAEAGNTVAADGCILTKYFPSSSLFISYNQEKTYGGYIVKRDTTGIKGEDESSASSFNIYYKNHLNSFSLNSSSTITDNLEASYKPHFEYINSNLPKGEIYCLTIGKSGPAVCGLEFIYGLNDNINKVGHNVTQTNVNKDQATTVSAAVYVGNDLIARTKNHFSILQEQGSRGCIVAGNKVTITKYGVTEQPMPNWYDTGSLIIDEGAIFAKEIELNKTSIPIDDNSNLVNYGVSAYSSPKVNVLIPELTESNNENLPSGTFCFIEMPCKNDFKQNEFNDLCSIIIDISLTPEQFNSIYGQYIEGGGLLGFLFNNTNGDIQEEINNLNTTINGYNENYNYADILTDKLNNKLSSFLVWLTMTPNEKNLYRLYITEQVNNIMTSYRKIQNEENITKNTYEAYFIPDGNFNINSSLNYTGANSLTYSDIIKARVYGNILETIKNHQPIGTSFREHLTEKAKEENPHLKENRQILKNIKNLQNNSDYSETYVTEKITKQDSTCYVVNKLSDHNIDTTNYTDTNTSDVNDKIRNLMESKNISFDTENEKDFTMSIEGDIKTEGFFNFATFERYPYNPSDYYISYLKSRYTDEEVQQLISENYEHYTSAINSRAKIKLGNVDSTENNTSIIANNINIKGSILGKGHVSSKGDISFEAYGSGIDGVDKNEQNWVSIWSMHDININTVSAYNSSAYGANSELITANFNGILYSSNNLNVNVYDNINFEVSGVIICGHDMKVYGINNFSVTYNPHLSNIILSRFVTGWEALTDELTEAINGVNSTNSNNSTLRTGRFKAFNRI